MAYMGMAQYGYGPIELWPNTVRRNADDARSLPMPRSIERRLRHAWSRQHSTDPKRYDR